MIIKIKRNTKTAKLPTMGSEYAAGYDLYADTDEPVGIGSGETHYISTGISIEIPNGYAGLIFARSGMATKKGLAPANKVGVIDPDYRGTVMVAIHNHSKEAKTIEPGERIAQLVVVPFLSCDFVEADSLTETERNNGGFGSSGSF